MNDCPMLKTNRPSLNEMHLSTGLEYVISQLKSLILSFGLIDRHLTVEQAVLLSRLEEEYQV